ncbi:MAG: hypothetical protein M3P32_05860 [Chloroflexota bacterium]|nr:hypothetical protein [Chloroflexota bacterium]
MTGVAGTDASTFATGVAQDALGRRFTAALTDAGLTRGPGDQSVVSGEELEELPATVQRYLGFMGVAGRPRVWSFRAQFRGRFWLRRELGWMSAVAWQYNSAPEIARVFVMRVRVGGIVPMVGCDTYLGGRGRMIGKVFNRLTVVDGHGEEFDIGELTTYLNDAVLLAPSMLLGPNTTWAEIDDRTFEVTLADAGRCVTGRVSIDESGAPSDFSTMDRFASLPSGLQRAEWHTPVQRWHSGNGRNLPGPVEAIWLLPDGPLPYVRGEFVPESLRYNVAPPS